MREIEINHQYTNSGLSIHIDIPYEKFKVVEMPSDCYHCPVGYMDHGCGRKTPFTPEDREKRPDTCKLTRIPEEDILAAIINAVQPKEIRIPAKEGFIVAKESLEEDYLGIFLVYQKDGNGEPGVCLELDKAKDKVLLRVWDKETVDADPKYLIDLS